MFKMNYSAQLCCDKGVQFGATRWLTDGVSNSFVQERFHNMENIYQKADFVAVFVLSPALSFLNYRFGLLLKSSKSDCQENLFSIL